MDFAVKCVFVANGQIQAEQVQSFLDAAGIRTVLRGEALRNAFGLTLDGLGAVEICVADADEERARTLLASAEVGEFRLGVRRRRTS